MSAKIKEKIDASIEGKLILIVITGVIFFAFHKVQYAHATLFISLLFYYVLTY